MNIHAMNRSQRKAAAKYIQAQNAKWPVHLTEVPRDQWPPNMPTRLLRVFRSRDFLVQEFAERDGIMRLSINRTEIGAKRWQDGISWDELQRLKGEAGYGSRDAVEIFPARPGRGLTRRAQSPGRGRGAACQ